MEVKGVDVGGFFNFIRNVPPDNEYTKEKQLWVHRCNNGMCPHCGQKLFKLRRLRFRKKFVPLTIAGKVDNGVCTHPSCDSLTKTRPNHPGSEVLDETAANPCHEDSSLDAIREYRADMAKYYLHMQDSDEKAKNEAAIKLEDAVMQLNRAVSELSLSDRGTVGKLQWELLRELDLAERALRSVQNQGFYGDQTTQTLRKQVRGLQREGTDTPSSKQPVVSSRHPSERSAEALDLKDYPQSTRFKCHQTLSQHSDPIACCAAVGDGEFIACGSKSTIYIWKQQRGSNKAYTFVQRLERHTDRVTCCAASEDARKTLVTGSDDRTLNVWIQDQKGDYRYLVTLRHHSDCVNCCSISGDGRVFVSGSKDKSVVIWKRRSNSEFQVEQVLADHAASVDCCVLTRTSTTSLIISGGADETLKVWKESTSKKFSCHQTLRGHTDGVLCCAVAARGAILVSGGKDTKLIVWKLQANGMFKYSSCLEDHTEWINCCAFSKCSSMLISGGDDDVLRVWTLRSNGAYRCVQVLKKHRNYVLSCFFVHSKAMIISGANDSNLKLWRLSRD